MKSSALRRANEVEHLFNGSFRMIISIWIILLQVVIITNLAGLNAPLQLLKRNVDRSRFRSAF